jgi:hypothetical protein
MNRIRAGTSRKVENGKDRAHLSSILLVAALGGLSVLLAACGGSPHATEKGGSTTSTTYGPAAPATTGSSGGNAPQQSALAFAACVRSHGVPNFPDSAIQSSSKGVMLSAPRGINVHSPQFQSAMQACRSFLPQGPSSGSSSSSYVQAVLKYSLCMRSHGVTNFPEPNSQGLFTGGAGINPNSPTFLSANESCQRYLPAGSVGG